MGVSPLRAFLTAVVLLAGAQSAASESLTTVTYPVVSMPCIEGYHTLSNGMTNPNCIAGYTTYTLSIATETDAIVTGSENLGYAETGDTSIATISTYFSFATYLSAITPTSAAVAAPTSVGTIMQPTVAPPSSTMSVFSGVAPAPTKMPHAALAAAGVAGIVAAAL